MIELNVKFVRSFDGGPLSVIDGFPGDQAEMTPLQLRQLSKLLLQVADASDEVHKKFKRIKNPIIQSKSFKLENESS